MKAKQLILILFLTITGFTNSYSQTYKRIVSLSRVITQDIYLLGANGNLVGCTSYCEMAISDKKEVIASAIDVNVEKVIMLKPDLVIATTITKPETIETLRKIGIKVVTFPTTKSYDDVCQNFKQIAEYTGKTSIAEAIIKQQNHRLDSIRKSIPDVPKPRIFFEIGTKPIFTVMPNTFMDDFITFSGGINVASDLTRGTITRESVLLRNPDVIIIITMGILGDEERNNWLACKQLSATKNNKIFFIDSNKACSPSPVTFIDVVEELIKLIYSPN